MESNQMVKLVKVIFYLLEELKKRTDYNEFKEIENKINKIL